MNHFYSRTTIDSLAPISGMPLQTMASMFGQGYTHTAPSFSMPNPGPAPYTPGCNGQTYTNNNDNYQASYSTIAYIGLIPLPDSSVGFLPNSAYHNVMRYNMQGQPKYNSFGYETPPQFPFRPQPIDMMPTRATSKLCVEPNNLTNQLATILRESLSIDPKGQGHVYQKPYPDYYDQLPYPRGYRVPELLAVGYPKV
jgi:hypothetical protein